MPRKIPPTIFLFCDDKVMMPETNEWWFKIVGFSGWDQILAENQRLLPVAEQLALAKPLLEARIAKYLPGAQFTLMPNRRSVSPSRIAQGAPRGARHWNVLIRDEEQVGYFTAYQKLIWHIPYDKW